MNVLRLAASAALTLLLFAVGVLVAVALLPQILNDGTVLVTIDRNSMQQVLPQGSAAYVRPTPDGIYPVGAYVTYPVNGKPTTHEVVEWLPSIKNADLDGSLLKTKGTNNAEPDPYEVNASEVVGQVYWSAPWIGVLLQTVAAPQAQLFAITLAAALAWVSGGGSILQTNKKGETSDQGHGVHQGTVDA